MQITHRNLLKYLSDCYYYVEEHFMFLLWFCMARELRMVFMFLDGCKKSKEE